MNLSASWWMSKWGNEFVSDRLGEWVGQWICQRTGDRYAEFWDMIEHLRFVQSRNPKNPCVARSLFLGGEVTAQILESRNPTQQKLVCHKWCVFWLRHRYYFFWLAALKEQTVQTKENRAVIKKHIITDGTIRKNNIFVGFGKAFFLRHVAPSTCIYFPW